MRITSNTMTPYIVPLLPFFQTELLPNRKLDRGIDIYRHCESCPLLTVSTKYMIQRVLRSQNNRSTYVLFDIEESLSRGHFLRRYASHPSFKPTNCSCKVCPIAFPFLFWLLFERVGLLKILCSMHRPPYRGREIICSFRGHVKRPKEKRLFLK